MTIRSGIYGAGLGWSDLGLSANPFPSRAAEMAGQNVFTQQDVFALSDQLQPLQVFTGITGVGKTVHAKQLAKHFLKNKRRATQLITASKTIKSSGLLKMICCRFNIELPAGDLVDSLKVDTIRRMILKRKEAISLIIDDAQNLSQESLNAVLRLTALQQEPIKLQVVLFGMPVLLDRVRKQWDALGIKEEFRQGMIRPWTSEQTFSYVLSRLQDSGLVSSRTICKKTCQKIHQLSGGVPMQINRRANMMLDQLIKGQIKPAKGTVLQGSFLWVTALMSAMTAMYFCYQAYTTPTQQPAWMSPELQSVAMEEAPTIDEMADISEEMVFSELQESMMLETVSAPIEENDGVLLLEQTSLEDTIEQALEQPELETEMFQTSEVAASEVGASEVAAVSEEAVPNWLNDYPEGYTVQVLATPDENEAYRVAKTYEHSHVLHVARQGKPTYVVLVGEFEALNDAKEEVSVLTETHLGSQPWVRRYSQLRTDVQSLHEIVE